MRYIYFTLISKIYDHSFLCYIFSFRLNKIMHQHFVSISAKTTSSSQQRKASPVLVHFMKITDDEYLCKNFKVATPSKEIKVKRDRSSSTIKLWNPLERFHVEIYKQIRPSNAPNTLTDYFSKTSKFSGRNSEQTNKECIDLIVKTDAPVTLLGHPQFKNFCNYLVQGEVGIARRHSRRRGVEKLFEDERNKVRELLRPIERVSLIIETWTTTNNVAILGITIHWIDDI